MARRNIKFLLVILFLSALFPFYVHSQEKTPGVVLIPPPIEGVTPTNTPRAQSLDVEDLSILTVDGAEHNFKVEVARDKEQQRIGMMFRNNVPDHTGMLFLFPKEAERTFWMRNTWVPLDMIFVRRDGIISHIHYNAEENSLEHIPSNGPAMAVLEIAGGEAERLRIHIGDRIIYPAFQGVEQ